MYPRMHVRRERACVRQRVPLPPSLSLSLLLGVEGGKRRVVGDQVRYSSSSKVGTDYVR